MNRKNFLKFGGILMLGGIALPVFAQVPSDKKKKYTVVSKRCDGCGHCFRACHEKALLTDTSGKAIIVQEKCKGCGDCIRFCRRMAIVEMVSDSSNVGAVN